MRRLMLTVATAAAAATGLGLLVLGAVTPRGQPLPYGRLEDMIHLGLFPDKPRDMSFVEYFENFTVIDANLSKILEKLEFGILDFDNLDTAIKLAEEVRRYKEIQLQHTRRQSNDMGQTIFNLEYNEEAWSNEQRDKLFQFMQHSAYSARAEINKLSLVRQKYRNSTVFSIGLQYGQILEMKAAGGEIYSAMARMHPSLSLIWYVLGAITEGQWYLFHFHKLLNMNYDVTSMVEYIFLLSQRIESSLYHVSAVPPLPQGDAFTSLDPQDLYKK